MLESSIGSGYENLKEAFLEGSGYNRLNEEAKDITRSLDLVYKEQSPLPLPKGIRYGDPLQASNNAVTHAYLSAKIAQLYGIPVAKALGDLREYKERPKQRRRGAEEPVLGRLQGHVEQ